MATNTITIHLTDPVASADRTFHVRAFTTNGLTSPIAPSPASFLEGWHSNGVCPGSEVLEAKIRGR